MRVLSQAEIDAMLAQLLTDPSVLPGKPQDGAANKPAEGGNDGKKASNT